jgi:hypothetical protein
LRGRGKRESKERVERKRRMEEGEEREYVKKE